LGDNLRGGFVMGLLGFLVFNTSQRNHCDDLYHGLVGLFFGRSFLGVIGGMDLRWRRINAKAKRMDL